MRAYARLCVFARIRPSAVAEPWRGGRGEDALVRVFGAFAVESQRRSRGEGGQAREGEGEAAGPGETRREEAAGAPGRPPACSAGRRRACRQRPICDYEPLVQLNARRRARQRAGKRRRGGVRVRADVPLVREYVSSALAVIWGRRLCWNGISGFANPEQRAGSRRGEFANIREHSPHIREHSRTFANLREHSRTFANAIPKAGARARGPARARGSCPSASPPPPNHYRDRQCMHA